MAYKPFLLLLPLFALMALDCNPKPTPVSPRPTPVVQDTEQCLSAEKHLEELKCIKHTFTPEGKSFSLFCQETQNAGVFLNPKCLATVNSCDQVDDCTHSR